MLVHRANSIVHWVEDCRDVTKTGGGGICTKNGSYSEKEKVRVGVRVDVNGEVKLLWKFKKKIFGWGGGGRVEGVGGQGGCELRSEAFVKIQKKKKKNFFFFGGGVGLGGGNRVDVNGEVKLL